MVTATARKLRLPLLEEARAKETLVVEGEAEVEAAKVELAAPRLRKLDSPLPRTLY